MFLAPQAQPQNHQTFTVLHATQGPAHGNFFFFSRYVSFYFYFSIFTRSIVVFPSAEILSYHTYTSGRIPCTGFAEKAGFGSPQVPTFPARTAARPPFSTSPARPTHAHQISRGKTISGTNISTTCCTWMCYLQQTVIICLEFVSEYTRHTAFSTKASKISCRIWRTCPISSFTTGVPFEYYASKVQPSFCEWYVGSYCHC